MAARRQAAFFLILMQIQPPGHSSGKEVFEP
jgi:hypothetical protein